MVALHMYGNRGARVGAIGIARAVSNVAESKPSSEDPSSTGLPSMAPSMALAAIPASKDGTIGEERTARAGPADRCLAAASLARILSLTVTASSGSESSGKSVPQVGHSYLEPSWSQYCQYLQTLPFG